MDWISWLFLALIAAVYLVLGALADGGVYRGGEWDCDDEPPSEGSGQ